MVESTWQSREFPVLKAMVEALEEHLDSEARLEELAERSGLPLTDVDRATRKLWVARPRYFQGIAVEDETIPIAVTSVTERALRETGQWPDPESLVRSLIDALQKAAETEADPDQKSRLTQAAETLKGIALQMAIGWAAGAIPH
jgi:hypothetical protein